MRHGLIAVVACTSVACEAGVQPRPWDGLNDDGHPLFGMTIDRADGEFESAGGIQAAVSIAFGDVDGDGDLDIVAATVGRDPGEPDSQSQVRIMLNRGDGVFDRASAYDAGREETMVALADLNGDGALDIVCAAATSDEIGILLGRGDGTFGQAVLCSAGDEPRSLVVGDFDGDGHLDIAALNTLSEDVSLLLGRGDGTFEPDRRVDFGGGVTGRGKENRHFPYPGPFLASGDVDNDGDCDLAIPMGRDVRFLLNDGQAGFALAEDPDSIIRAPTVNAYDVELVDLDSDGDLDALACVHNDFQSMVVVGRNAGNGRFPDVRSYSTAALGPNKLYRSATMDVGDVDGDGMPDVVVGNFVASGVFLLRNIGDAAFAPVEVIDQPDHPWVVGLADLNGDGTKDLATTSDSTRGWITVSLNDREGGFRVPDKPESGLEERITINQMRVSDYDGDGVLDALVVGHISQEPEDVWLLKGAVGPSFNVSDSADFPIADLGMEWTGAGDIDGDGLDDFVLVGTVPWFTADADGILWVSINPGDGTLGEFQRFDLPHAHADSPVIADFDGDGHNDLAIYEGEAMFTEDRDRPIERRVVIFRNQGDGTLAFQQRVVMWIGGQDSSGFGGLGAIDLDLDGDFDLVCTSGLAREPSRMCILENDGSGSFSVRSCEVIGNDAYDIVVDDFDGDGLSDLAVMHWQYRENGPYLTIYRGDGGGLVEDQTYSDIISPGAGYLLSADVNADGAPDLLFPIANANAIVVHLNDGSGGFASRAIYAGYDMAWAIATGDFDKDGDIDVLANRPGPEEDFWLLKNVGPRCPADLDGDGDADSDDFFFYLEAFAAGDMGVCDLDADGDCDADDFFAYLTLFGTPCA